jgi:uncharacterized membrane protein
MQQPRMPALMRFHVGIKLRVQRVDQGQTMTSADERRLASRFARRTRYLRQHARLSVAALLGLLAYLALPTRIGESARLLAAFDLAAFAFLAAIWIMMARATTAGMRQRARREDESRYVVLALSAATAAAVLLAIALELHGIRDQPPAAAGARVALATIAILLAWFFMNTMFALHYAHYFYGDAAGATDSEVRGLAFPGGGAPDYWDFLYFSFTIGMTFQVSDVQITDPAVRRVALAHAIASFFFATGILAMSINLVSGLYQ